MALLYRITEQKTELTHAGSGSSEPPAASMAPEELWFLLPSRGVSVGGGFLTPHSVPQAGPSVRQRGFWEESKVPLMYTWRCSLWGEHSPSFFPCLH